MDDFKYSPSPSPMNTDPFADPPLIAPAPDAQPGGDSTTEPAAAPAG